MDPRVKAAFERVKLIDLTPICQKLSSSEHGEGWSESDVDEARLLYISYLSLLLAYRNEPCVLAPPVAADRFWHQHILDTRKYMRDSVALFGEYLHHFPYFGMRGDEDARNLEVSGQLTRRLIIENFGDIRSHRDVVAKTYLTESATCGGGSCSSCSSALFASEVRQELIQFRT